MMQVPREWTDDDYARAAEAAALPQDAPATEDRYALAAEQAGTLGTTELMASMTRAVEVVPDVAAKAKALSAKTGIPTDIILYDYHAVDRDAQLKDAYSLFTTNPELSAFLSNETNAKVSHDDTQNLKLTEDAFKRLGAGKPVLLQTAERAAMGAIQAEERTALQGITEPLRRGYAQFERNLTLMLADPKSLEAAAVLKEEQRAIERYPMPPDIMRASEAIHAETTLGGVLGAVAKNPALVEEVILESMGTGAVGLLATAMAGPAGAIPMAAATGLSSFAIEYSATLGEVLDARDAKDPLEIQAMLSNDAVMADAKVKATKRGVPVAVFDALTAGLAGKLLSGARRSIMSVAPRAAGEAALQMAGGAAGEAGAQVATGEWNLADIVLEAIAELPTAAVEVPSNMRRAYDVARDRDAKMSAAEQSGDTLQEIAEAVQASKVRERSPETFTDWLNQVGKDVPTVHLDAEALAKSGLEAQVVAASPSVAEQIAVGGEMTIPTTEYLEKIVPLDKQNVLVDDIRLPGEEFTRREAMAVQPEETLVKEFQDTVAKTGEIEQFRQSAREVERTLQDQLMATGRYTQPEASSYAKLVSEFVAVSAANLKMLPMDWYRASPYKVTTAAGPPGEMAVFNQADIWSAPDQAITSSKTSVNKNKLPATFNLVEFEPGTINADIGGGRYDNGTAYLANKGVENIIWDAFNRDKAHNDSAAKRLAGGQADTATVNNTLNVIAEPVNRDRVITQAADAIKAGGTAYFLIYEGDKSGIGRATTSGWQENRETQSYLTEIERHFGAVSRRGNLVTASNPRKLADSAATAGADPTNATEVAEAARLWKELGTDSPYFKKFFGVSPVVDTKGEPLVVYHGTDTGFVQFKDGLTWATADAAMASRFADRQAFARAEIAKGSERTADDYAEEFEKPGAAGQRVLPVYLSTQKMLDLTPLRLRASVRQVVAFLSEAGVLDPLSARDISKIAETIGLSPGYDRMHTYAIIEALGFYDDIRAKGYDGIKIIDSGVKGESFEAYAVFSPGQVKSATANQGTFDVTDPNILKQGERGGFDPKTLTTLLHEKADLSTFLHETGHFFLHASALQAASPNATPKMRQDMQTILDWFGVQDLATWQGMTVDQQRQYHEQWAYNFEVYLFEGKAPSPQMRDIFQDFMAWLARVYKNIRGELNALYQQQFGVDLPILTGEVREVMDRMLASQELVDYEEAVNAMAPMFTTQAESEMSDEQWAAYELFGMDATQVAAATLARAKLTQMRWLGGARSKYLRSLQATTKATRARVRQEIEKQAALEPVYRALDFLRHGRSVNAQGVVGPAQPVHRIAIADMDRPGMPDAKSLGYGKYGVWAKDGLPADMVAEMFGFDSGEEMVHAMLSAKPLQEAVDAKTDAVMLAEHAEMVDPTSIERGVQEALHNAARSQFIAVELRHLSSRKLPAQALQDAARVAAQRQLSETTLSAIKPRDYRAAETRASKRAAAAARANDYRMAEREKRRQLFYHQLTTEALKVLRETEQATKSFGPIFHRDATVVKTRDMDLVNAARFILGHYGLGPKNVAPESFLSPLQLYNPDLHALIAPILTDALTGAKDYRQLTLSEFRQLHETVEALWFRAKRDKEVMVTGKAVALDTVVGELRDRLDEIDSAPAEAPGEHRAVTRKEKFKLGLAGGMALLRTVESWADAMDGPGGPGPFTTYLWRPVRAAIDRYRADRNRYVKQYVEMVGELALKPGKIAAPEIGYSFGDENGSIGKAELLGALLHIGNDSNKKKLLVGRGWGTLDERTGALDTSRWDRFLARMFAEGVLTKADMDFVQKVWDLNEQMKPLAQAAHRDLFGYYFKEVPANPVVTPFGTYRGGYVPAKVDPDIVKGQEQKHAMDALEADFKNAMPSTAHGFTKERSDYYNQPLSLDIRVMAKHIDDVLLFSHVQSHIKDALKILRDRGLAGALNQQNSSTIGGLLVPWLERAARQQTTTAGVWQPMDTFWRTVRSRTGISVMFANLSNALQQVTGFFPALLKVQRGYLGAALMDFMRHPHETAQFVASKSLFMDDRLNSKMVEVQDRLNELIVNPSALDTLQRWSVQHGYFMQMAFQNVVDLSVWTGAYNQALAEDQSEGEAITRADAAVRLTQSSIQPEDVAAYQVGTPFYRTMTQFTGYFNTLANLNATEYTKAFRDLGWRKNPKQLFMIYLLGFAAPMLVADAIVRSLGGGWDDDDHDGYLDVFASWFFGSQGRGLLALVPFGSALAVPVNALNDKTYDDRLTTSPSVSALEAVLVGVPKAGYNLIAEGKSLTGKNVKDIATMFSLATGIPFSLIGRPGGYAVDVERGKVRPTSEADYIRGLITGKASEASRK